MIGERRNEARTKKGVAAMATTQITLGLPEELARDARELGILTHEMLIDFLQQEVDQRVMALVNAEIHTHRAEKREQ
jgi:hypothetical protein